MKHNFSIIIPVYREGQIINQAIQNIRMLKDGAQAQIIVVDGNSAQDTLKEITFPAVKKIASVRGRGSQMNAGSSEAAGDILIFLHADTRLPNDTLTLITAALDDEAVRAGAFDLGIDSGRFAFRIIERMASWRSRLTRIPYGDQAIFIRAAYFKLLGGFRSIPIMEEVDLMRRIKKRNDRITILRERVWTSARRWETEGLIACTLRNWLLITLYLLGMKPETLTRFYK
jgi:rSAM/selenodomain-associated transferase 2